MPESCFRRPTFWTSPHRLALRPHRDRASFFMATLSTIDSIATLMRTFAIGTFPQIIANPSRHHSAAL